MRSIGAQIGLLGDDYAKVEENPLLFLSDRWVMGAVNYMHGVGMTADTILEKLEAPPTTVRIHEWAEQMAWGIKVNMARMEESVDNADMNALVAAVFNMDDTSSKARYIHLLINSFCE